MASPQSTAIPFRQHEPRFWASVERSDVGCWLWRGRKNRKGYGEFSIDGVSLKAHRVSWLLSIGMIPAGMCVCHRCDVPACVRPDHLFMGTVLDNNRDCIAKGRKPSFAERGNQNSRKTTCKNGHPLSGDNLMVVGKRQERRCRTCRVERKRSERRAVQAV